MQAPQIIYLVIVGIGLLIAAHDHGKERTPQNFWTALIASAIAITLLWWGGFFN